jgi:hypothetical protein
LVAALATMSAEMMALLGMKPVEVEKPPTPPPRVAEEHPFGVVSLYLTDSTCKMFSIDKKEAKNNQHFVVDTKSVKEDISLKGAISDFHVVKGSLMVGLTLINLVKIKQQFERPYTS